LVLWIDARDPELYREGHIKGAHLLNLYDKSAYLAEVTAAIDAQRPDALVVYCKGLDCTDSHHLAQDLQDMGYENIFDYRGGFDAWYQAGYEIEGELAAINPPPEDAITTDQAETQAWVAANLGITDIDLAGAYRIFRYAADLTLWIDAREPALFEEGHIKGAQLLYLYDESTYLPLIEAKIEELNPVALVVYCKGKDCTDSHHLAQDLQDRGHANIFVYRDGFDDWYAAGYAIEGALASAAKPAGAAAAADAGTAAPALTLPEKRPPGMYLEHILRDLLPFVFGFLLLVFWKKTAHSRTWVLSASVVVGLFFIWAAFPKIENPFEFAKNIWNYDIAPAVLVNITALIMPMLELICGIGLVTGAYRRGSSLLVGVLLLIFIAAVGFNVVRGHEFNCGCTSQQTVFSQVYLEGWNDKITLLLRDLGLLVMSAMALLYRRPNQT